MSFYSPQQQDTTITNSNNTNSLFDESVLEYDIKEPIYPIPQVVKHYEPYIAYQNSVRDDKTRIMTFDDILKKYPNVFPYDEAFKRWYRNTKQIADRRKLRSEPFKRKINAIWRYKLRDKEKVVYSESFTGIDTKTGKEITFKHLWGLYSVHRIVNEYDDAADDFIPKLKGVEKMYWLDYSPELIEDLMKYKPLDSEQIKMVVVMNRTYGGLDVFKEPEFRDQSIDKLTRLALSAKGLKPSEVNMEAKPDDIKQALDIILKSPDALNAIANHINLQKKTSNKQESPK